MIQPRGIRRRKTAPASSPVLRGVLEPAISSYADTVRSTNANFCMEPARAATSISPRTYTHTHLSIYQLAHKSFGYILLFITRFLCIFR